MINIKQLYGCKSPSPSWAESNIIRANFLERTTVFMESRNSSIRLGLHDCVTTKKMAVTMQKHLDTSTSLYVNFLTGSPIPVFIQAERLQLP